MSTHAPPGRQLNITDALARAPTQEDTIQDDRVVDDGLTCDCGRPAGASGQCPACRMEAAGDTIGNHGRRL